MTKRTRLQRLRQEHREGGRYTKVNPCYACGKSAGDDYLSHPMTDKNKWDDTAICLCKKCHKATYDMVKVEDFLEYQTKQLPKQ